MQIQTIRVTVEPCADNPLGFVNINLSDFDGAKHEAFDDESRGILAGAVETGEIVPTMAELLAARDQLMSRERELNAERDRLADQARANEVEAQRLANEKAAAEKLARETAAVAEAVAKGAAEKVAAKPAKAADDKK